MMIYINEQAHPFSENKTLSDVLDELNIDALKGMAVAINNNVVPREKWDVLKINDNDKLLIIKAAQGG
jgi:sulfur carrier protein